MYIRISVLAVYMHANVEYKTGARASEDVGRALTQCCVHIATGSSESKIRLTSLATEPPAPQSRNVNDLRQSGAIDIFVLFRLYMHSLYIIFLRRCGFCVGIMYLCRPIVLASFGAGRASDSRSADSCFTRARRECLFDDSCQMKNYFTGF